MCSLWSTELKHESRTFKCLCCKLWSTFTTFGAYLLQVSMVPSEKSNPTRTGNFLAEVQAEKVIQSCWVSPGSITSNHVYTILPLEALCSLWIMSLGCVLPPVASLDFSDIWTRDLLIWSDSLDWACLVAGSAVSVCVLKALWLIDVFKSRRDS